MNSPFNQSPESLNELRVLVLDWVRKSADAVQSFYRSKDDSFWRDSRRAIRIAEKLDTDYPSITTTARCYMALVAANRCPVELDASASHDWAQRFTDFCRGSHLELSGKQLHAKGENDPFNNFDIAHLGDLLYCEQYLRAFYPSDAPAEYTVAGHKGSFDLRREIRSHLLRMFEELRKQGGTPSECAWKDGRLAFEGLGQGSEKGVLKERPTTDPSKAKRWVGHHYFVTLHSMRALAIIDRQLSWPSNGGEAECTGLIEHVRAFCVEQCYHAMRKNLHRQDVMSLTFAIVIYCLYSNEVDPDICEAAIEAICAAQNDHGSWPATHPILRGSKELPWHITSHEVALCLTWLYFQPRVPDSARDTLLAMMERYFRQWVIRTFVNVAKPDKVVEDRSKETLEFRGWYDDHTTTTDFAVGWATGIVCHFLANYYWVLCDHINRRVIESLELQTSSYNYLIDSTAPKERRSPRWAKREDATANGGQRRYRPTWPDVPPFGWWYQLEDESKKSDEEEQLAKAIQRRWTDSGPDEGGHSLALATQVLRPVLHDRTGRPPRGRVAGVLPGSPGTRKSSLVKTVADVLEWPRIMVPASLIFDCGFDLMEARANKVFGNLRQLTGCVLFFDEFEEFFRDRREDAGMKPPVHNRTIAAFTTSAMLPRLQDLNDARRCLIFFATNHPKKVDPAILRQGRFDYCLEIEHPTPKTVERFLREPTDRTLKDLNVVIEPGGMAPKKDGEANQKYGQIRDAVQHAIDKDEDLQRGNARIRFITVEAVLRDVESKQRELAKDKGKSITTEKEKLKQEARHSLAKWRLRHGKPHEEQALPHLGTLPDP